jgi:hypothetical protein
MACHPFPTLSERINMSNLESKAFALAEATPPHLGQPTLPPIKWRQEGDELVVILADGRKVRGPLYPLNEPEKVVHAPTKKTVTPLPSTPAKQTFNRKNK